MCHTVLGVLVLTSVISTARCGIPFGSIPPTVIALISLPFSRIIYYMLGTAILVCVLSIYFSNGKSEKTTPIPVEPRQPEGLRSSSNEVHLDPGEAALLGESVEEISAVFLAQSMSALRPGQESEMSTYSLPEGAGLVRGEDRSGTARWVLSSLSEHNLTQDRLKTARQEVEELRRSLTNLREERDSIMAVAEEIARKCENAVVHSAAVLRTVLKKELEKGKNSSPAEKVDVSIKKELQNCQVEPSGASDCRFCKDVKELEVKKIVQVQSPTNWKPVTGSEEFRNFLLTSYDMTAIE